MDIEIENLEDEDIEVKIKELLKMGYVRVDEEFLNKSAKRFFKDEYKREKFIESEMKKGYLIGIRCGNSVHKYTEKFIRSHDLIWFKMMHKCK